MKVRCLDIYPPEDELDRLGPDFYQRQEFAVRRNLEYVVLGMFVARTEPFGNGVWIVFRDEDGGYSQAPLLMFEIIDDRASQHWRVRIFDNGNVAIGPPSFDRDVYMEDFYEGVPEIVEDFRRVCDQLESEFPNPV